MRDGHRCGDASARASQHFDLAAPGGTLALGLGERETVRRQPEGRPGQQAGHASGGGTSGCSDGHGRQKLRASASFVLFPSRPMSA